MRSRRNALTMFSLGGLLLLTPVGAFAQGVPCSANADCLPAEVTHRCGLLDAISGNPLPPPDFTESFDPVSMTTQDPAFRIGRFVESVIDPPRTFSGVFGAIDWTCAVSADPTGPSPPTVTAMVDAAGDSHPSEIVVTAGANVSMQLRIDRQPGVTGPPLMVPFQMEMSGSVFVDPISHTNVVAQTTVTAPIRLTLPFTFISLNDVGGTDQFTFIQHVSSINNAGLCCIRTGGVPPGSSAETCAPPVPPRQGVRRSARSPIS